MTPTANSNRLPAQVLPRQVEQPNNVESIANLPPNLAIMKMENDNVCALAAAHPRDHHKIKADLIEQIDAYPSFARNIIYCKPVGKDQRGQMQYARGLSIRAAEALAEAYGYNRVRAEISPLDEDHVKIEASFTDYQRGRIWQDSGIISKFYRARTGLMVRHADDRFYGLICKAEKSKLIREVIVRSVPPGLRSELMEMAEIKIDELLDDATVQKIIGQFASKSVSLEMLEVHIGRTLGAGWKKEDRRNLLGIWNAIKDGEVSVDEAFAKTESKPQGNVAASDLTSPKQKEELKPEVKAETKTEPQLHVPGAEPGADADASGQQFPDQPPPGPSVAELEMAANDLYDSIWERIQAAQNTRDLADVGGEMMRGREQLGENYESLNTAYQERYKAVAPQKPAAAPAGKKSRKF